MVQFSTSRRIEPYQGVPPTPTLTVFFSDRLIFKPDCVILVTFGTVGYKAYPIDKMIEVFTQFTQCYFHVRSDKTSQFVNGYTSENPLPQKEILSQTNTKVFISHCGQNSINEVFYKINMNY
uniref:Uncharacterized protein n=1 Tax=Meloidogyne enterolobii TaxID=390850 RepID=A0A6V7YBP7_MELEN|nr:unnamed protein product [Meloidogyne enterolobii]